MANTEESIQENGIPEISFTMSPSTTVPQAIDKTLTVSDEAADAKTVGDRLRTLRQDMNGKNATTLYMDSTETDTIAGVIEQIKAWTAEDIPIEDSSTITVKTIVDAVQAIYPVGSIVMTTGNTQPPTLFSGWTWQEILITATWNQIENGHRDYTAGSGSGNVHFWVRTA